jgi:hypothetical protein
VTKTKKPKAVSGTAKPAAKSKAPAAETDEDIGGEAPAQPAGGDTLNF